MNQIRPAHWVTVEHAKTIQQERNGETHSRQRCRKSPTTRPVTCSKLNLRSYNRVFPAKNEAHKTHRRSKSAPSLQRPASKYSRNILDVRGKDYDSNRNVTLAQDILNCLRSQSIPRRVQRIVSEARLKECKDDNKDGIGHGTKSTNALGNKEILEKRRGLQLRKSVNKSEAREKMGCAFYSVFLILRVKHAMTRSSIEFSPATNTQISWSKTRYTRESSDVLFSKSYFQKKSSVYSHVPDWAQLILKKNPVDRSERDLMQIHAMMHGLASYDKFTRRIQLAMCRSMKYSRIEYPRVILRRGHVGQAFYIIFNGSVFINVEELNIQTNTIKHKTVSTLQRGDAFGEVALLRNIQRTASVAVKEDVELMVVDKSVFGQVCSAINEREMEEKVTFCRHLPLFKYWKDDAIKHICQEAQIHEYKINQIIVQNKTDEEDWIYICMQGKCRVIKKLDFNKKPERSGRVLSKYMQEEKSSTFYDTEAENIERDANEIFRLPKHLEIMNELKINLEQTDLRKIASNQILDDENAMKQRSIENEKTVLKKMGEAELILTSLGKEYNFLPHCTGETKYCIVNTDEKPWVQKKKQNDVEHHDFITDIKRRKSIDLTALLNEETKRGRLNKKFVYLNIATIEQGNVFNLCEVLEPKGRELILVSLAAKILKIKKQTFFRLATKKCILDAKISASDKSYPDDDILYYQFRKKCTWDAIKTQVLQRTMTHITHGSSDHKQSKTEEKFTVKERAKSARQIVSSLRT